MLIVSLIVIQVIIFGGLIFILRSILSQNVNLATRHLDELNNDYTQKETGLKRQLEEAQKRAAEIVAKAQEEAQQNKARLMTETETQRNKLLQETHTQAEV